MDDKAGTNEPGQWFPFRRKRLSDIPLTKACADALLGRGLLDDANQMFVRNSQRELEVRDLPGCGRSVFLGQFDDGDHTYWLCLEDESIWLLDGYEGDPQEARWVNSSVIGLQGVLEAWVAFHSSGLSAEDEHYDAMVSEVTERARQADPKAFEDEASWWSLVFDEIENGALGPGPEPGDPMADIVIMTYPEDLT